MRKLKIFFLLLAAALLMSGCAMSTADKLYCLPKRAEEYENLQAVIDKSMANYTYCAPLYGENRQVWQVADLDGDGIDEHLIFAKDDSERPLKILIFCQLASGYVLMDTIEGYGFAFDYISYAQMDDQPGVELIVGRQLSDDLTGNISIYRFTSGFSRLLLSTGYSHHTITDMDNDGLSELFLLMHGMAEKSNGAALLYRYKDGELHRSAEIQLSAPITGFKLMQTGYLQTGRPVIYVTSSPDGISLVTDIFAIENGKLQSFMSDLSVDTLQNYFVYPADMDNDNVLELPRLVPLEQANDTSRREYLIEWFSLNADKTKNIKLHTYHNFADNWYFRLDEEMYDHLSVEQTEQGCVFYINGEPALTILALKDADRVEQSQQPGWIILYSSETVIYVAYPEPESEVYEMFTTAEIRKRFTPIRVDLNTERDGHQ